MGIRWSETDNSLDAIHVNSIFETIEGMTFTITAKQGGVFNDNPYYIVDFIGFKLYEEDVVEQL